MRKQQKQREIFFYIFLTISLFIAGYYILQGIKLADERVARSYCQYAREELKTNEFFYLTDSEREICEELGEL